MKSMIFFKDKIPITNFYFPYQLKYPKLRENQILYSIQRGDDTLIRSFEPIPFIHRVNGLKSGMYSRKCMYELYEHDTPYKNAYFYFYDRMVKENYQYVHLL